MGLYIETERQDEMLHMDKLVRLLYTTTKEDG